MFTTSEDIESFLASLYTLNKDTAIKDSTTELDWRKILNRSLEITGNARTYCSKVVMFDPEITNLASNEYISYWSTLDYISPDRWHVKQYVWDQELGDLYDEWVTIGDMHYQNVGFSWLNTEKGMYDETNQDLLVKNSLTILQNETPSSFEFYSYEGSRYLLLQYASRVEKDNMHGFF